MGLFFCRQKKHRKAQKHMECSYTVVILLPLILETETHWFSTWQGMVVARIWLDIIYTGR